MKKEDIVKTVQSIMKIKRPSKDAIEGLADIYSWLSASNCADLTGKTCDVNEEDPATFCGRCVAMGEAKEYIGRVIDKYGKPFPSSS